MKVPYVDLVQQHQPLKEEILAAISQILDQGDFVLGQQVTKFEENIARYCGVKYALGLNSGTDALFLALKAYGVGPGDEVIIPPNSFLATATCVVATGATPVFVDTKKDLNINPALVEEKITSKTKAIIPVHLTGRPADMDPIMDLARKYELKVIEDSAQAIGAEYKGVKVGALGDVGCFSLHPLKTLNACGDGGFLTTNDPDLYHKVLQLRNIGLKNRNESEIWGYNSRLDTIQAAILNLKLEHLDSWNTARRKNAALYQDLLRDIVYVPEDSPHEKQVFHTFVIQTEVRDELQKFLSEQGVDTKIHYPIPIHKQPVALKTLDDKSSYSITEKTNHQILSLPVHQGLTEEQIQYVAQKIREYVGVDACV